MHLPEPTKGGDFEQVPAGNHLAICYRFIDLGTQEDTYMGEVKKRHQVMISWELPNALMQNGEYAGKPFTYHETFTWSMHEKAKLRQVLESWRGKKFTDADFGEHGFNIRNILGVPCLLNLVHKQSGEKTYTNMGSVSPLVQGMQAPDLVNPQVYLALTPDDFEMTTYMGLSENVRLKIATSPEYQKITDNTGPARAHEQIPAEAYVSV